MATSNIRFGKGVTREIGMDLADRGIQRVLVVTDANLASKPPVHTVLEALDDEKISYDLFDQVRVEPTDVSMKEAIQAAVAGNYDGFVAVGGGSTIDTAKVANLYASHPVDDFLHYVNAPIGKGAPVPGPVKPLFAGLSSRYPGIFELAIRAIKTLAGRGIAALSELIYVVGISEISNPAY